MEVINIDDSNQASQVQLMDDRVLKDVVAYVEVRSECDDRSAPFGRELEKLGATVVPKFTHEVTHVVFKEGTNRTRQKAEKKGVHLVSVLWVDECKQRQEHVPETLFPIRTVESPLVVGRPKKFKNMQPVDFKEDLARRAGKANRKKQRLLDEMDRVLQCGLTPTFSPQGRIIVQDTQTKSSEDGFILTPARLAIPDTPPSMREKMRKLREAKQGAGGSYTVSDGDLEKEAHYRSMEPLQKNLFKSQIGSGDISLNLSPADNSSVFLSDSEVQIPSQGSRSGGSVSDTSVNEDILTMVIGINTTLHRDLGNRQHLHTESDDSLSLSQEHASGRVQNPEALFKPLFFSTAQPDESSNTNKVEMKSRNVVNGRGNKVCIKGRKRRSRTLSVHESVERIHDDSVPKSTSQTGDFLNIIADGGKAAEKVGGSAESSSEAISSERQEPNTYVTSGTDSSDSQGRKRGKNKDSRSRSKQKYVIKANEDKDVNVGITSFGEEQSTLSGHSVVGGDSNSQNKINCGTDMIETSTTDLAKQSCTSRRRTRSQLMSTAVPSTASEDLSGGSNGDKDIPVKSVNETSTNKQKIKPKKIKKKLLSLTDLNDRHSILLEPTKASTVDRLELVDDIGKTESNSKRDNTAADNDIELENDENNKTSQSGKTKLLKRQKRGKRKLENSRDDPCTKRAKGTSNMASQGVNDDVTVKKILVNDSFVKESDSVSVIGSTNNSKLGESHLQDLTTQLNLTKDGTIPPSSRDTTLSISMSRIYNDTNIPAVLIPPRRCSIDEFNLAVRNPARRRALKSSLLALKEEKVGDQSSMSESDRSSSDSTITKHRKGKRPSLVMTSLHSCEQDVVISVVKKLGGFVIAETVNETTTHVVCGEARRTLNVLHCLARGIWLLSKEWVLKSLESDRWIPEAEFECYDNYPICKVARLEREKCMGLYRQTMFSTVGPLYVSGRSSPPRPQLVQLIKLCGGKVTGNLDKASIFIGSDFHPGVVCVKTSWLLDCITSHSLLATEAYSLDQPKRESSPVY